MTADAATRTGLEGLTEAVKEAGSGRALPPVHLWNPPFCGDIDMRIAADGLWFYMGTPIGRPALVKLFSSVLRREGDKYFLVTPVEKVGIIVDDAPFAAVEMRQEGDTLSFRTQVDEWVSADADHPLRFEAEEGTGGLKPYVLVRKDLWARLSRALYYDLVALGEVRSHEGEDWFGVASAGRFFPMTPASALDGA